MPIVWKWRMKIARLTLPVAVLALAAALTGQTNEEAAELEFKVAMLAVDDGNFAVAKTRLENAVRLAPANGLSHYNLAIVNQRLGAPEAALDSLRRALQLGLPAAQQKLAQDLLPRLIYEQERSDATFTWLLEQRGSSGLALCGVSYITQRTHFEGVGCDMTLVTQVEVNSLNNRDDERRTNRDRNVLSRIRATRPIVVDNTHCRTGERLSTNYGVEITLAPQPGESNSTTLWLQRAMMSQAIDQLDRASKACRAR